MKRLITIALILICSFTAVAQEHLKFKGIPIDGKYDDFSKAMVTAGFQKYPDLDSDNFRAFEGEFMNRDSKIIVYHTEKGLVYRVMVLHEYDSWRKLSSAFDDAAELYTTKYGLPSSKFAFFSEPYENGDGYELQALRKDKCHYLYTWDVPWGVIGIRLVAYGDSYFLAMVYEDTMNTEMKSIEDEQKALSDI